MKKLLSFLLSLALCLGTACAEPFYQVSEASVNEDALKTIAFGERITAAKLEQREYGYRFYALDENGPPFCGAGGVNPWHVGCQSSVSIFRETYANDLYVFGTDNVVSSGTAACGLTRDGALAQATGVMDALEVGEYALLSITAYGRQSGTVPCYEVAFRQTVNGCPVYWFTDGNELWPRGYSNLIRIYLGDEGLIYLEGFWSDCSNAIGETAESLTMEQALEAFAGIGIQADEAQKCYYMRSMGQTVGMVAYPAWRVGNNYLSTAGAWLQIISSPQLVKNP